MSLSPLWLAAAPAALAAAIWTFIDLQRFVLFAVLLAMIFPTALVHPGGTQVALADILLLVALLVWLISASAGAASGPFLKGNRLLGPALVFVAVNAASLMWSDRPRDTVAFTIQLFEIVVLFPLVFASLPRSIDVIRHAMLAFIALTCGMAVITTGILVERGLTSAVLPYELNKNVVGSYLAAGLVMAYALALGARDGRLRHLLWVAAFIELAGIFSTLSRGSLLGSIAALIAVSLLLRRNRVVTLALMAVLAAGYVATNGLDSRSAAERSISGSYDSSEVRVHAFEGAIEKIKERPLLGSGGGTYRDVLPQLDGGFTLLDPNNMFLLTWAELGILGLVALCILFLRYGALLIAVARLPEEAAVTAVAAGCVTLSLLVHFQVDVSWTRGTTSLAFAMMGLMVGIRRLSPEIADTPAPDTVPAQANSGVGAAAGVA